MRKRGHWSGTTLVLLAAMSCGEDEAFAPGVTVTDSAGVRIVHHAVRQSRLYWAVVTESSVSLAGDVETALFRIGAALKLSDGWRDRGTCVPSRAQVL